MTIESGTIESVNGQTVFTSIAKNYVCHVHGDIGEETLSSTIPGFEMRLCLRCYLEKLQELGVQQVKEKEA
jgi:hypothetical protein